MLLYMVLILKHHLGNSWVNRMFRSPGILHKEMFSTATKLRNLDSPKL